MEYAIPNSTPTLFGVVREQNVTFCIDTSGSMYQLIDAVKDHLIEVLCDRAHNKSGTLFNIIEFNTEVTQWSDRMVKCKPQTVAVAEEWIKCLSAKTGTNTQEALLTALSDQACEAVYLVTDGLPDCNTNELLDHVYYASKGRPIHCIYLKSSISSDEATQYLEDMAQETYGSFHIVSITTNGAIENVIPIYRSNHAAERIIRTTDGSIYPNVKTCSITTTLDSPDIVIPPTVHLGTDGIVYPGHFPIPRYYHAYRHLWPHDNWPGYSPYWWSRYRPTQTWLRNQKVMEETAETADGISFSPGAGSLLIGKEVLARRKENGCYYLGTVKNQLLAHKFLVEFGPCRHGKFRDTVYQETYIHDIISYQDALRHAIVAGDKVLAPWSHKGEKFGPGIVLEGVEKRYTDGNCEDKELTVTFYNGKTEKVPLGIAVWVPDALHERVKFELSLPAKVRNEMAQDQEYSEYPEENKPGYPISGSVRDPLAYEHTRPILYHGDPVGYDTGRYHHPSYVPIYPIVHRHTPRKPSVVQSTEMDKLIPGTEMTKDELNEKVMSQLMEHKLLLDRKARYGSAESEKLLSKRSSLRSSRGLRRTKSVEFNLNKNQNHSDLETEFDEDLEVENLSDDFIDSGIDGTGTDEFDYEYELQNWNTETNDFGNRPRRRYRQYTNSKPGRITKRPPWRYWNSDPTPDVVDPPTFEPYEERVAPVPLEKRGYRLNEYGVEWTDTMLDEVDQLRGSGYVQEPSGRVLYQPQPPMRPRPPGPRIEVGIGLDRRQVEEDHRQQATRDFRLRKSMEREHRHADQVNTEHAARQYFDDGHRSRIQAQLDRDRVRHETQLQQVQNTHDAKRVIGNEIRTHFREREEFGQGREARKMAALQAKRESRDNVARQQDVERETITQVRQGVKEARSQARCDAHTQRLNQEEVRTAGIDRQHQRAKLDRREHYHRLEQAGQKYKDDRMHVSDQQQALFRSTVLP